VPQAVAVSILESCLRVSGQIGAVGRTARLGLPAFKVAPFYAFDAVPSVPNRGPPHSSRDCWDTAIAALPRVDQYPRCHTLGWHHSRRSPTPPYHLTRRPSAVAYGTGVRVILGERRGKHGRGSPSAAEAAADPALTASPVAFHVGDADLSALEPSSPRGGWHQEVSGAPRHSHFNPTRFSRTSRCKVLSRATQLQSP
jgi:hypothetical protein